MIFAVPLTDFRGSQPQALKVQNKSELSFRTVNEFWYYAVTSSVTLPKGAAGPGEMRVNARITKGTVTFAAGEQNQSKLIEGIAVNASTEPVSVVLPIPDLARVGSVVILNSSKEGASEGSVFSIEFHKRS
jgi:hypothetical protein